MLTPTTGTVVFGRYALRRELARGCMGSVWVALDKRLRRQVAVKLMMPVWAECEDARSRFELEAMAVAQLRSPHIVQIFDYGIDHEIPFIVMEMLEGEDLRGRLKRQKRMSLEETSMLVAQAAKGLAAAHAVGIVHRDLKPANLFLLQSGDEELLKLLDFGVAKADVVRNEDEEATQVGLVLGTPQYMSPEQARGMPTIDHRADLWSLGVIAYRCLTGRVPFSGATATDVIVGILTSRARPASQYAAHLTVAVDEFFERALAHDPAKRFSSAREMAMALAAIAPVSFPSLNMPVPTRELFAADAKRPPPRPSASATNAAKAGKPTRPSSDDSLHDPLAPPAAVSGSGMSASIPEACPSGAQWIALPDSDVLDIGETATPEEPTAEEPTTGQAVTAPKEPATRGAAATPEEPATGEAVVIEQAAERAATPNVEPEPCEPDVVLPLDQLVPRPSKKGLRLAGFAFVALILGGALVFVATNDDRPPTANAASPTPDGVENASNSNPRISEAKSGDSVKLPTETTIAEVGSPQTEASASGPLDTPVATEPNPKPTPNKPVDSGRSQVRQRRTATPIRRPPTPAAKPPDKSPPAKTEPDPFGERL